MVTHRHGSTPFAVFQRYNTSPTAFFGLLAGAGLGSQMPVGTLGGALLGAVLGLLITARLERKPLTHQSSEE